MSKKPVIIFLLLSYAVCLNAETSSKAKVFGIVGFAFSLIAIGADIMGDHYYDKYEEAILAGDCTYYRNRTVICERARNITFGMAVINFSLSTVYWLTEKNTGIGLELNYKKEKLCIGLKKAF